VVGGVVVPVAFVVVVVVVGGEVTAMVPPVTLADLASRHA